MTRRRILALRVRGRSPTKRTASGLSALPSARTMASAISARKASPSSKPGRTTTKTTTASPLISCGTPTAAAAATAGWARAAASTSAGPRRLPATLMVSSERPRMYQKPSTSISAQSPFTHGPTHGVAHLVHHVDVHPRHGAGKAARLEGRDRGAADDATGNLGPAGV